jgi:hypothetical protein
MSDCCSGPVPCCGGGTYVDDYRYGPQPFVDGSVDTFAGPAPRLSTSLSRADVLGTLRVRLNVGRNDYRVKPGLYAVGEPDDTAPVLVTANYKLTVDAVRSALAGRNAWILVVDSRGVNVWCAAGKGVFSTDEVVRMVREAKLEQVVSHNKLVLPQLGATGVAAHKVRAQSGFSVVWGPVRVADVGEFLDAGMKVSPKMRRVEFPISERLKLAGVELSVLWSWQALMALVALVGVTVALFRWAPTFALPVALLTGAAVLAVAAGAVVTPALLPWLPGRAFALKGGIAGGFVLAIALLAATGGRTQTFWSWGLLLMGTALASFVAMNFTGSSTYTSPSGVEWEMRKAIPIQLTLAVVGLALYVVGLVVR